MKPHLSTLFSKKFKFFEIAEKSYFSVGNWGAFQEKRSFKTNDLGADYEARTRYLHLGKVALYQMS